MSRGLWAVNSGRTWGGFLQPATLVSDTAAHAMPGAMLAHGSEPTAHGPSHAWFPTSPLPQP
jgi:hypothetical protein